MASLLPDPLQLWRDAVTRLESEVNSLASGGMQSQEVLRALHQFSSVSLGTQQMIDKVIGGYLRKANLPSRSEIAELAESLRRIEDKLDRLLFVPRDLGHPKVIDAWMQAIDAGDVTSLVARHGSAMAGCTAIVSDALSWSRHVGELRVLVSPDWRGKGLGRLLIQECFAQALELGLKKLVAQMTTDQRAAIAVFEELGFRAEALLAKHVAGGDGRLHDLVLLSHDVAAVEARNELYGLGDALGTNA